MGPDLSEIGSLRSAAQLRAALTQPDAEVAPEYWTLQARSRSGQQISGIRLNEDTFSYQYRDQSGLRAVLKEELAEHTTVPSSVMPSFAGKLSERDIDDRELRAVFTDDEVGYYLPHLDHVLATGEPVVLRGRAASVARDLRTGAGGQPHGVADRKPRRGRRPLE